MRTKQGGSKAARVCVVAVDTNINNNNNNNNNAQNAHNNIMNNAGGHQKDFNFLNSIKRNSSLMSSSFTIEQWELTRRLRNSGLTKEQICQAYDDIERVERELGSIYNAPVAAATATTPFTAHNNHHHHHHNGPPVADIHIVKSAVVNGGALTSQKQPNGFSHHQSNVPAVTSNSNELQPNGAPTASSVVSNYFAGIMEPEKENRDIAAFRSRGEIVIQNEISAFVTKHDLKQSQIARMAGVNQAYVSKFLRGDFIDLSENGKTLIYKWYLRFLKHPTIYLQAFNINLNASSNISSIDSNKSKSLLNSNHAPPTYSSYPSISTMAYEAPKRTRFSFKSEHLVILEKSFQENQYPDQKRREELAKLCNDARPCLERERVTEQIITHWFQNKRKITRKSNNSNNDDKSSSNGFGGGGATSNNLDQINFDFIDDYKSPSKSNNEDDMDDEDDGEGEDESIY